MAFHIADKSFKKVQASVEVIMLYTPKIESKNKRKQTERKSARDEKMGKKTKIVTILHRILCKEK